MYALEEKVDELEKQNKELRTVYDQIVNQVQMLRSVLSVNKIDLAEIRQNDKTAVEPSTSQAAPSSIGQQTASQPISQPVNATADPAISSTFDRRETMQHEMMKMGPSYNSFDVLVAAANNSG